MGAPKTRSTRRTSGVQFAQRRRFLVIEDEAGIRRPLRFMLREYGEVIEASSAVEATRLLEASLVWSLMIVDVGLPDGDGLEVLAEARSRGCDCPAIVFTADNAARTINRAAKLDVVFLAKPATLPEVQEQVARLLASTERVDAALNGWVARYKLTVREAQIFGAKVHGASDADVCAEFTITPETLATHRKHILFKLRSGGRDEETFEQAVKGFLLEVLRTDRRHR